MATSHHQCHCHCTMCYTTHYPPPPNPMCYTTHYPPPPNPLIHSHHHHHPPQIHQYPPPQTHPTVSSLIHRISALESTLLLRRRKQSPSLRDAAARTIQAHFRSYLVQRSVTLRHLKLLAHIRAALNRLKSSQTHFHPHTISRESMSLLIKLDSIQGSDPMIRDGKRSISRELIRFMELIDDEKQVISVKSVGFGKNSKKAASRDFGYQERKFLENLKNARKCDENGPSVSQIRKVDLGPSQPKVKKNVSFDENGNVYRLFKSGHDPDGSDDSNGDDGEVEVEEIGISLKDTEVEEEDESSEMSGNEMDHPRKNLRTRVHRRIKKNRPDQEEEDDEADSFVFSAPLPAKMEY
ncbi:BAG family molecular chaperone regulator 8, chloroplastic-like [Bidens hawaiensis]|uniref:BAG family molecular chaperone regulator 8, chloroplastic-like n=1 Tax=Bidens hawaiensis TaxID=980011 RepID=UPI00404AB38E